MQATQEKLLPMQAAQEKHLLVRRGKQKAEDPVQLNQRPRS